MGCCRSKPLGAKSSPQPAAPVFEIQVTGVGKPGRRGTADFKKRTVINSSHNDNDAMVASFDFDNQNPAKSNSKALRIKERGLVQDAATANPSQKISKQQSNMSVMSIYSGFGDEYVTPSGTPSRNQNTAVGIMRSPSTGSTYGFDGELSGSAVGASSPAKVKKLRGRDPSGKFGFGSPSPLIEDSRESSTDDQLEAKYENTIDIDRQVTKRRPSDEAARARAKEEAEQRELMEAKKEQLRLRNQELAAQSQREAEQAARAKKAEEEAREAAEAEAAALRELEAKTKAEEARRATLAMEERKRAEEAALKLRKEAQEAAEKARLEAEESERQKRETEAAEKAQNDAEAAAEKQRKDAEAAELARKKAEANEAEERERRERERQAEEERARKKLEEEQIRMQAEAERLAEEARIQAEAAKKKAEMEAAAKEKERAEAEAAAAVLAAEETRKIVAELQYKWPIGTRVSLSPSCTSEAVYGPLEDNVEGVISEIDTSEDAGANRIVVKASTGQKWKYTDGDLANLGAVDSDTKNRERLKSWWAPSKASDSDENRKFATEDERVQAQASIDDTNARLADVTFDFSFGAAPTVTEKSSDISDSKDEASVNTEDTNKRLEEVKFDFSFAAEPTKPDTTLSATAPLELSPPAPSELSPPIPEDEPPTPPVESPPIPPSDSPPPPSDKMPPSVILSDEDDPTNPQLTRRQSMETARKLLEARVAAEKQQSDDFEPAPLRRTGSKPWERDAKSIYMKTEAKLEPLQSDGSTGSSDVGSWSSDGSSIPPSPALEVPGTQNTPVRMRNKGSTASAPRHRRSIFGRKKKDRDQAESVPGTPTLGVPAKNSPRSHRRSIFGGKRKQSNLVLAKTQSNDEGPSAAGMMGAIVAAKKFARALKDTKMMTVAEIEAGGDDDDQWEELDQRAIDAAKWTDKEIGRVIEEIKKRGYEQEDGNTAITFGQLFDETDQIFDALSGILKTCKKYDVVSFDGEQLWQGQNDKTVIVLLKEKHDGIKIKRRKRADLKGAPTNAKTSGFGNEFQHGMKCIVCTKTIYQAEYVGASGKAFHKTCFKCYTCKKMLKQTDFFVSRDKNFRCAAHHREFEMTAM